MSTLSAALAANVPVALNFMIAKTPRSAKAAKETAKDLFASLRSLAPLRPRNLPWETNSMKKWLGQRARVIVKVVDGKWRLE